MNPAHGGVYFLLLVLRNLFHVPGFGGEQASEGAGERCLRMYIQLDAAMRLTSRIAAPVSKNAGVDDAHGHPGAAGRLT